jgi:tRNA dimethylallyltransferase
MRNPEHAYEALKHGAPAYAAKLSSNDRYRIEKGLRILLRTGEDPLDYFHRHPPRPVITAPLPLFEIDIDSSQLRERIHRRTKTMLEQGLLDEVAGLESRYGRSPSSMKAIGITEVLSYFDGEYSYQGMKEKIITHTARLAKRQRTFNRSQFGHICRKPYGELRNEIIRVMEM